LALVIRPFIFRVYGPDFAESVDPFFLLLPGVVFLGGAKILSADLSGRGLPGYNAIGSFISLVVTVGLDLLLIPFHGTRGAAVASSVAYFTTLCYVVIVYLRVVKARPSVLFRIDRADLLTLKESLRRFGTGSFK
jgi:O-antigen/teichoic acid export membrane protein